MGAARSALIQPKNFMDEKQLNDQQTSQRRLFRQLHAAGIQPTTARCRILERLELSRCVPLAAEQLCRQLYEMEQEVSYGTIFRLLHEFAGA